MRPAVRFPGQGRRSRFNMWRGAAAPAPFGDRISLVANLCVRLPLHVHCPMPPFSFHPTAVEGRSGLLAPRGVENNFN
jgi:hypothetical protein